jgi:hypothetical protein
MGGMRTAYLIAVRKLRGGDHLVVLGINGGMILK